MKDVNPFDDETDEWEEPGYVLEDNGEPGVPVRALYDYEAAEPDELTFKTGERLVTRVELDYVKILDNFRNLDIRCFGSFFYLSFIVLIHVCISNVCRT